MGAAPSPITILYRDEHYVVVDKPAGLLVHRTAIDAWDRRSLAQKLRRQHQVRRHLEHLRHPVIGDANYGDLVHNRFFRARFGVDRLLLAATSIGFVHPYTAAPIQVVAPLDDTFRRVCRELGWEHAADGPIDPRPFA